MLSDKFLSQTERKIFLVLTLLICSVFYSYCIDKYNQAIKDEQIDKRVRSSGISFSVDSIAPPDYTQFFKFQFFTNPLLFFLIWKRNFLGFAFSFLLNSIFGLSLLTWILWLSDGFLSIRDELDFSQSFQEYLSSIYESKLLILALLSSVFLTLQFFILIRFAIEKFQAKISLR